MGTFGFTADDRTNKIALNGDLDFSINTQNVMGVIDEGSHDQATSLSIKASSGTQITELLNGVMRLDQGGPLAIDYDFFNGTSSAAGTVSIGAGQCFSNLLSSDAPLDVVACN